jgi:hypothetical protein
MKRLIYQVYIPIRGQSNLYDFCIDSVSKYCKKYDIDHFILKEPKLKIKPDMDKTSRNKLGLLKEAGDTLIIFEKEYSFTFFDQYDQIAVIDADIYIRDSAPNIFDELSEQYDFGGVLERSLPLTDSHRRKIQGYSKDMFERLNDVDWNWNKDGAEFMNMGMMLMNKSLIKYFNGQTPEEFIRRPEFKRFVDGDGLWKYSTDQVLLNWWLKKENIRVKHLEWKWNGLYRGAVDDQIKHAHFVHFFLKQQLPDKGENLEQLRKILS